MSSIVPLSRLKTLVLNADLQALSTWPLSLISAQAAIGALCRDRVYVLENWPNAEFRSPSTTIPVPKVVALKIYAPIHTKPKFCRRSILLRDRFKCQYCGKRFEANELTFDHVIPRAKGGKTEWTNILTACIECNTDKRDELPKWSAGKGHRLRPLKTPRQPTTAELLHAGLEFLDDEARDTWGDYLYWNTELDP